MSKWPKKIVVTLYILLCAIAFLVTSIPGLYEDVINPDGINWHTRAYNFTEALINKEFDKTFQAYHPGVTLMWLTGPTLHSLGSFYNSKGIEIYSRETFLNYDYFAKVIMVSVSLLLFLLSLFLLKKIVSVKVLIAYSIFMIFEPFVIGLRRLYHLDYLTAAFLFLSFLCIYIYSFKDNRFRYYLFSILTFVLAFLTKTTALIFFPFIPVIILFGKQNVRKKFLPIILIPFLSFVFLFILFPALWGSPLRTIPSLYNKIVPGIVDIGFYNKKEIGSSGQEQTIILDDIKGNSFWYFYLLELPLILSPITFGLLLISLFVLMFKIFKKEAGSLEILSFLISAVFIVGLSFASKKGLRYAIIYLPFLFIIISVWMEKLHLKTFKTVLIVLLISLIPQYIKIFPYFYVYGSPLFGGVKARTEIFKPSSFGVGAYQVSKYIESALKPTASYSLAGSKSFKYTSPYAKVKSWPNCSSDFAVIYFDDDQPDKVCPGTYTLFKKVMIGNLDYWTIYKNNNFNSQLLQ
jgi:hypothetical protein